MPVRTIARLAAVEIAVHGWDVARTTGAGLPIPEEFAEALMPTALALALEQHGEFGPPVPVPVDAGPERRMLALLGQTRRPLALLLVLRDVLLEPPVGDQPDDRHRDEEARCRSSGCTNAARMPRM